MQQIFIVQRVLPRAFLASGERAPWGLNQLPDNIIELFVRLSLSFLTVRTPKDKRAALRTHRRLLRLRLPLSPRYNATSAWRHSPDLELR